MTKAEYTEFVSDLFEKMHTLISQKNADYACGDDPFANFRISERVGIPTLKGLYLRMQDKCQRIEAYLSRGSLEVPDEGIENCFEDLIGYSALALGILEETTESTPAETESVRDF